MHARTQSTSAPANVPSPQGTFGREPAAVKPDDDRYLRAAIQEYDNIAKLGQIIREGPIKVSPPCGSCTHTPSGPYTQTSELGLAPDDTGMGEGPGKQLSPPLGSARSALHWARATGQKEGPGHRADRALLQPAVAQSPCGSWPVTVTRLCSQPSLYPWIGCLCILDY